MAVAPCNSEPEVPVAAAKPRSQIRTMITPLRNVLNGLFTDARRVSSTPSTAISTVDVQACAVCDSSSDDIHELANLSGMPDSDEQKLVSSQGWTLEHLIEIGMKPVERVSALLSASDIQTAIRKYENDGIPIIIEDWHKSAQWPKDGLFTVDWLLEHGEQKILARNSRTRKDDEMLLSSFIELSRSASHFATEDGSEPARYYGKDAVCPKPWKLWLLDGALPEELLPGGPDDVLEFLSDTERVETLMCYLGIGDTYTAAHKDLCASSGHNLMCYTENGGSSFWFMTRSSDAPIVATWFQKARYELDHETYVVSPEEFAKAPFPVFVAEQKVGDLVLVPKRSCHQVINHGGLTVKMSWSRMTVDGLVTAFHHELPVYRRVCRQETYRVKLLTYRALLKYSGDIEQAQQNSTRNSSPLSPLSDILSWTASLITLPPLNFDIDTKHRTAYDRLAKLLELFDKIIVEEYNEDADCELRVASSHAALPQNSSPGSPPSSRASLSHDVESPASAGDGLTCDFCGADIFQSFFECKICVSTKRNSNESMVMSVGALMPDTPEADHVLLCPGCYVEGRSCRCGVMTAVQRLSSERLIEDRNRAANLLNQDMLTEEEKTKIMPLSVQTLKTVTHPQIFRSACKILLRRIALKSAAQKDLYRSCSRQFNMRHMASAVAVLGCNGCHHACCFVHMLNMPIHVSEALMRYGQQKSNALWHAYHIKRSADSHRLRAEAEEAERLGAPYNMGICLALYAQKYFACFPFNTETVDQGWYDEYNLAKTKEEPEEVPMPPNRPRKRNSETTKKTGIVKKSSSRSVSPRRAISDRSSVLTTSSTESGATQTGHYADAYVEVPKLYSTSRNKYKPMGTWDPDRAEIAKTAANKKSQSIVEVFNGAYGQQPDQPEASASTARRNKRVTVSAPMKEYSRKRRISVDSEFSSDLSDDIRKMAYRDSDPDYTERLSKAPPLRESSKRPTTFRPKNISKGRSGRRQRIHKRIYSPEPEANAEDYRSTDCKQPELMAPPKASKQPRLEQPKSPLPKFKKRKKLDAAAESSADRAVGFPIRPSGLNNYPQTIHPDLAVDRLSTKGKAEITALEKKVDELNARLFRQEMDNRKKITDLQGKYQQLLLMYQNIVTSIGYGTSGAHTLDEQDAWRSGDYAPLVNNAGPVVNQANIFVTNGVGHSGMAFNGDQFRSQLVDTGRFEGNILERPVKMDGPHQNAANSAHARQYMSKHNNPPFASSSRLPAPSARPDSVVSTIPESIQAKESQKEVKASRWDVKPDTIGAAAREADPASRLPPSSWDASSSQSQSQPQVLEFPTSQSGAPSSPTPTSRKVIRPSLLVPAPAPSRAPTVRMSMMSRRSIIIPDSDRNSESSRTQ